MEMNANGDYVVAWKGDGATGQIEARVYSTSDQIVRELTVSTAATDARFPHNPSVAISSGGNFVVAWDELHLGAGAGQRDVLFREFNGDGDSLSGPTVLNAVGRDSGFPDPAMDDEGNFIVVWQDQVQDAELGIKGRWYASSDPTSPIQVDYHEWIARFFDSGNPDAGPDADPDGDDVTNREEFAFAGDPTDGRKSGQVTRASLANGNRVIQYGRVKNAGFHYLVQYSFGLDNWIDGLAGVDFSQSVEEIVGTETEEVSITLSDELIRRGAVFIRVRFTEKM